ncbi:MAG: phosphoserine phosphatase RsbU/P [Solirubrobacteraceae bacterium]|nr:phosphoserine phosphatase RsbU/P [Solirubrobacteraceae bacterium]
MTEEELLADSAEDLFEDAPCGYITTRLDGTILKVNRTFESWLGLPREKLLGDVRFQDLLSPGGRIYHETHYLPLLQMQGSVRGIAAELVRADGSRLAVLINSVLRRDDAGTPQVIRTTVFDATDRRRYEEELLAARRREHDIALQLQRSMLSGELPSTPCLDLQVSYTPAVTGLEIGGDWYDAFWLDDRETVGLVVGDVVGRGIDAAATMGQLRSAVRALAITDLAPAAVLEALDQYARRHGVGLMTTLVYAELDVETGGLRFACAGHPPPLILEPSGEAHFDWGGRSLPLNVARHPERREQAACTLASGSTIILYTDGLIERRRVSLGDGMSRLMQEVVDRRHEPVERLVPELTRELADPTRADDVCVLAGRLKPR